MAIIGDQLLQQTDRDYRFLALMVSHSRKGV
jgi:hypothetical protein